MILNEDEVRDALESYAKTGRADDGVIKFMSPKEAADALGKHLDTIYRQLYSGALEGYQLRGTWYVPAVRLDVPAEDAPADELEEYVELSPRVLVRRLRAKDTE